MKCYNRLRNFRELRQREVRHSPAPSDQDRRRGDNHIVGYYVFMYRIRGRGFVHKTTDAASGRGYAAGERWRRAAPYTRVLGDLAKRRRGGSRLGGERFGYSFTNRPLKEHLDRANRQFSATYRRKLRHVRMDGPSYPYCEIRNDLYEAAGDHGLFAEALQAYVLVLHESKRWTA